MSRQTQAVTRPRFHVFLTLFFLLAPICVIAGSGESRAASEADYEGYWEIKRTDSQGRPEHMIREHRFGASPLLKVAALRDGTIVQMTQYYFPTGRSYAVTDTALELRDAEGAYQVFELTGKDGMRINFPKANTPYSIDAARIAEPSGGLWRGNPPRHETMAGKWVEVDDAKASFTFDPAKGILEFAGVAEAKEILGAGAMELRFIVTDDDEMVLMFPDGYASNPVVIMQPSGPGKVDVGISNQGSSSFFGTFEQKK